MNDGLYSQGRYSKTIAKNNKMAAAKIVMAIIAALAIVGFMIFDLLKPMAPQITSTSQLYRYKGSTVVKITTDEFYYTGAYDTSGTKTTAYYYFVSLDGGFATVRSRKDYTEEEEQQVHTFVGTIRTDSYYDENVGYFAQMADMSEEEAADYLHALEITDATIESKTWVLLLLIPVGFLLMSAFGSIKQNKKNMGTLEGYTSVEQAERAFERDSENGNVLKVSTLELTPNWIFNKASSGTYLLPANELVWIYKTVTQHRTNGIPSGKSFSVNMYFSSGFASTVPMSQAKVDQVIQYISGICPHAFVGFSDDLKQGWNKDRANLLSYWRQKKMSEPARESMAADASAAASPAPSPVDGDNNADSGHSGEER